MPKSIANPYKMYCTFTQASMATATQRLVVPMGESSLPRHWNESNSIQASREQT